MGCYAEYFWGRMTASEGMLSVFVSSSWGNSVASGTIISKGWVSAVSVPDVATGPWSNGRCVCGCRSLSCSETSLMLSSLVFVYPSLESASPGESPHAIAETYGFSFALFLASSIASSAAEVCATGTGVSSSPSTNSRFCFAVFVALSIS